MELVGDRLTFREDVAQVLCAKNIPDYGGDYYYGHGNNDSDIDNDNVDDKMSPRFFVPRTFLMMTIMIAVVMMMMSPRFFVPKIFLIRRMGLFLRAFHFQ